MKISVGPTLLIFLFLPCPQVQSQEPSPASVEIVAGGEVYKSLQEYKAKKLKVILEEIFLKADPEQLEALWAELLSEYPGTGWDNLKKEEILPLIDRAKLKYPELMPSSPDTDHLEEMQGMLDDFLEDNKDVGNLVIDPEKIKTIHVGNEIQN